MNRRQLLAAGAGALLAPSMTRPAWALGEASKVDVCEIVLPSGTVSRPSAWLRMQYKIQSVTSVEVADRVVQVAPEDPKLFEHPFAVLCGDSALPEMTETQVQQLARYISYGGFLFIDDTSGTEESSPFDVSVRRLLDRLFPTRPLHPLDADHSLYRAFFFIHHPVGRVNTHRSLEGIQHGEIWPVVYCRNDLSGAMEVGSDGQPLRAVIPQGEAQRREAHKLGVNLMMYALTSNYKKDQAHVDELIREGRLTRGY